MGDGPREGVLIPVKAVPGSRADAIAGMLGDRLKVKVSAPAHGGRANDAVCSLIARSLGVRARDVSVEQGRTSPEKVVRVTGSPFASAAEALKHLVP